MNWDAIGAVGEIVGAGAVVISLVYLALQIRVQNAESRAAAQHDFIVGWREVSAAFTNGELAEIWVRANKGPDGLTEVELLQLVASLHGPTRLFEEAYDQFRKRRLESHLWAAVNRQFSALFSAPAYQEYWKLRKDYCHEDFQTYVDEMIKTGWKLR
jgi:hypothetical protein